MNRETQSHQVGYNMDGTARASGPALIPARKRRSRPHFRAPGIAISIGMLSGPSNGTIGVSESVAERPKTNGVQIGRFGPTLGLIVLKLRTNAGVASWCLRMVLQRAQKGLGAAPQVCLGLSLSRKESRFTLDTGMERSNNGSRPLTALDGSVTAVGN